MIVSLYKKHSYKVENWEETSFSRALKTKIGLPLRKLVNQSLLYGVTSEVVKQFVSKYGEVYALPIDDLGTIRGFLLRSVKGKDFRVVSDGRPLLYGMHRFNGFKYGRTVFLSEGVKDAEAIATEYPYSLALFGNRIGREQGEVLKKLTNKIVFVIDGDYYGRKGGKSAGSGAQSVSFPFGKDLGEYWEEGSDKEMIRNYIQLLVKTYP